MTILDLPISSFIQNSIDISVNGDSFNLSEASISSLFPRLEHDNYLVQIETSNIDGIEYHSNESHSNELSPAINTDVSSFFYFHGSNEDIESNIFSSSLHGIHDNGYMSLVLIPSGIGHGAIELINFVDNGNYAPIDETYTHVDAKPTTNVIDPTISTDVVPVVVAPDLHPVDAINPAITTDVVPVVVAPDLHPVDAINPAITTDVASTDVASTDVDSTDAASTDAASTDVDQKVSDKDADSKDSNVDKA